jgi:hypothetical protein
LADALLLLGRKEEGGRLFDRLLSLRNDVGLLSEEYDVTAGRLVFPQAFSQYGAEYRATKHARPSRGPANPNLELDVDAKLADCG